MAVHQRVSGAIKLLLLVVVALGLLLLGQLAFKHLRIDLTEDKVYTLSEGTRNIVTGLEQPVELEFFYSENAMRDAPTLRNYAQRIDNMLEEFELLSNGAISLVRIDPEPFSEEEDRATELGMQAVPLRVGGAQLYLGLAATGASGNEEVITFLHPNREQFLEYDVAKSIYLAARAEPPKLGLLAGLQVGGGLDMATRSMGRPWASVQQLDQFFDVVDLGPNPPIIPEDIDLLVAIHPAELTDQARFAIDQFVLSGRSAIIFVDPHAESADAAPGATAMPGAKPTASDLPQLFQAWGIEMVPGKVLGDAAHAMLVNIGDDMPPARNLALLGLTAENMATEELVTEDLDTLNMSAVGVWRKLEGSETEWRELLWSSNAAGLVDVAKVQGMMDPNVLFEDFVPDGEHHAIAGLLSGKAQTAFPEGKPALEGEAPPAADAAAEPEAAALQEGEINVLLVADTDILTDRLWVQVNTFFGQPVLSPFADNGSLLVNASDYLAGSPDLISIRSRGTFARPFTRVHEIQREAEESYRATADKLSADLQATEQQLTRLMQAGEGGEQKVLTPEQEAAVDEILAQKVTIRKALREVQHELTSDIESLGTKLKLINIGLIPVLLTLLVLALALVRRLRQRTN